MTERAALSIDTDAKRGAGSYLKIIVLVAVLVGTIAIAHFTPVRAYLQDVEALRARIRELGNWVYPVTILAVAVMVSCGIPRLLFCAAGGMLFGFLRGLILTQAGTLLGYYCIFLFIRWAGHEWATRRWPKLNQLGGFVGKQGIPGVILIRQLPLHGTLINLCLGLSNVRHRDFLIGSAIGMLTEAIPATLIGAGIIKTSLDQSAGHIAIAVIAIVGIWIACSAILRKMRKTRAGAAIMDEAARDVQ